MQLNLELLETIGKNPKLGSILFFGLKPNSVVAYVNKQGVKQLGVVVFDLSKTDKNVKHITFHLKLINEQGVDTGETYLLTGLDRVLSTWESLLYFKADEVWQENYKN